MAESRQDQVGQGLPEAWAVTMPVRPAGVKKHKMRGGSIELRTNSVLPARLVWHELRRVNSREGGERGQHVRSF